MDVSKLIDQIRTDESIVIPPDHKMFVGSKTKESFLDAGCAGLEYLVQYGFRPNHTILDVGCGIGRVAVPLTYFLKDGQYFGFDPDHSGIVWCKENIESRYSNFHFDFIDVKNMTYNKNGKMNTAQLVLPYEESSFDFMLFFSIFTHLVTDEALRYLDIIESHLKVGGRAIATWFLVNDRIKELLAQGRRKNFLTHSMGPLYSHPNGPTGRVQGFDEDFVLHEIRKRRLSIVELVRGSWIPKKGPVDLQDMIIIERY